MLVADAASGVSCPGQERPALFVAAVALVCCLPALLMTSAAATARAAHLVAGPHTRSPCRPAASTWVTSRCSVICRVTRVVPGTKTAQVETKRQRVLYARPWVEVLVHVAGALSGAAGRRAFASRGAPRALLLCGAAWLASLLAVRRRRVARRHYTSMVGR